MYTSDQQIIEALRSSHQRDQALQWVYKECTPMIRQLGWNFNISAEETKDILQEAVIVLWKKVTSSNFVLTSKISTYIYQICNYKLLNKSRESKKASLVDINTIGDNLAEEFSDEELYTSRSVTLALYLNELGERCRSLIVEFYSGTSMKALASKYNYSNQESATAQKHKCIMQLRKKFEKNMR